MGGASPSKSCERLGPFGSLGWFQFEAEKRLGRPLALQMMAFEILNSKF